MILRQKHKEEYITRKEYEELLAKAQVVLMSADNLAPKITYITAPKEIAALKRQIWRFGRH